VHAENFSGLLGPFLGRSLVMTVSVWGWQSGNDRLERFVLALRSLAHHQHLRELVAALAAAFGLLTGASAGFGTQFTRTLAARGSDPVLVAHSDQALLPSCGHETRYRSRSSSPTVRSLMLDVAVAVDLTQEFCGCAGSPSTPPPKLSR